MFLLGQDGIVGFESVFFQELLSTSDLEVEKGVSETKDGVGHRGCEVGRSCGYPIDRDLGFIAPLLTQVLLGVTENSRGIPTTAAKLHRKIEILISHNS